MKKAIIILISIILMLNLSGCNNKEKVTPTSEPTAPEPATSKPIQPTPTTFEEDDPNKPVINYQTDFEDGEDEYVGGFADYLKGEEEFYELNAKVEDIPDLSSKGFLLSGNNHSADLLSFITRGFEALPNTEYHLSISFDIATSVPQGMMGVGGSPGASVYVKAGVNNIAFIPSIDATNYLRSNWDIGNQSQDGLFSKTLGNVEKESGEDETYQYKRFTEDFYVTTVEDGMIYIFLAIDSGFESISSIYFDNITVTIK